jgi:leucyl/phenylalanyl-tRNA---protein transferase
MLTKNFTENLFGHYCFPKPHDSILVSIGGVFSSGLLLSAYEQGVFPWGRNDQGHILWCSPQPRCVLYPEQLRINNTTQKLLKNPPYTVQFDRDFSQIMRLCASTPRARQPNESWIDESFVEAYTQLHHLGYAHSVAVYEGDCLVGGLYGIFLGSVFFGESMVSLKKNASKIAFFQMVRMLMSKGQLTLIDCQQSSDHLLSWGATQISREQFVAHLRQHASRLVMHGAWG